jgi:hypothetical protein
MDKKKKTTRFLKNRQWKSKCLHRLKGRPADICRDYWSGLIDQVILTHPKEGAHK